MREHSLSMIHCLQVQAALECYRVGDGTSRLIAIYHNGYLNTGPHFHTRSAVRAEVHYRNRVVALTEVHYIDLELAEVAH